MATDTMPAEAVMPAMGARGADKSIMTVLGIIEGEAVAYLERKGATTLRHLVHQLDWPARMIMMAVGALIREGLVRAEARELELVLTPLCRPGRLYGDYDPVPEVWGG
jgi:hypothetical protein